MYSVASEVKGRNLIDASRGLGLPEYVALGTMETLPSVLKLDSFHGPSTTDQTGLPAKVAAASTCPFR